MVGRMELEKDWPTFIRVAHEMQLRNGHRCAFLAVGAGSQEVVLRSQAQRMGVSNLFFLGYRQDVPALLAQSDVFLLTSQHEPFGMVLLEAMAAGCPIICTRSGGPDYLLSDGKNALLVEVGDVPIIADHLTRLFSDPDLRQRLSENGREHAGCYGLDIYAERLAALYEESLQ